MKNLNWGQCEWQRLLNLYLRCSNNRSRDPVVHDEFYKVGRFVVPIKVLYLQILKAVFES